MSHAHGKYAYAIYSSSIEHDKANCIGDLRAITLKNFYLVEWGSGGGKPCKLHQLYRADFKGYSPDWYKKGHQGYLLRRYLLNLKESAKIA